jgi:hypothetical protein
MEISSNMTKISSSVNTKEVKTEFTQKISQDDAKEIKMKITQRTNEMMQKSISVQSEMASKTDDQFQNNYKEFKSFLDDIGYDGKPIAELSKDEANELIGEDGIFGIKQTSQRIANFVIEGANGDEELLRAGRDGMLQGFKDAEDMWGSELPDISKETMKKALELVDKHIHELGFSVLDEEV